MPVYERLLVGELNRPQETEGLPRLTAEVFVISEGVGQYLVYAPLRRAAFVANGRLVNLLHDLGLGRFRAQDDPDGSLIEFLRRMEIVDAAPERVPADLAEGELAPTEVTLFLTTACNLRCGYCYARAGETKASFMSFDVARRAIDVVVGHALQRPEKHFELGYHGGGEPTQSWAVLTKSFDYARDQADAHGLTFSATTVTNGVLSDEKLSWIIEHLDGLSLSFDGLPAAQDANRPLARGGGSSEHVERVLRRLDAAQFPYGVRFTVTHDQIASLPEAVHYTCTRFRPLRIQIEPAYALGRWQAAPSAETVEFIAAYREARQIAANLECDLFYSGARIDALTSHFCGASQDGFSITPTGSVSGCFEVFRDEEQHAPTFLYGQLNDVGGVDLDRAKLNHLRNRTGPNLEYCKGCFARWHCAGDCYHKALSVEGAEEFRGTDRCHINRELTRDQILARILDSGGLFWHEPAPDEKGEA